MWRPMGLLHKVFGLKKTGNNRGVHQFVNRVCAVLVSDSKVVFKKKSNELETLLKVL